jgi:polar amino acid transport system substrate-binding protein
LSRRWLLGPIIAAALAVPTPAFAQPALRWGGDESGGAPYIYEKDGQRVGFETELADYLARRLGRPAQFVQKPWDNLLNDLKRGDVDCVLNGYEWSLEREQAMASTVPYYIFRLQLVARGDDGGLRSWDDLRHKPGTPKKKVGVLQASAAHRFLEEKYKDDIEIQALGDEGTTGVMQLVWKGSLDATLQDLPAARFYVGPGREFPTLRLVGRPVEPGYYVVFVRPRDKELREQLDQALREAFRDGTLRRIYEKYGLWNADQERLGELLQHPWRLGVAPERILSELRKLLDEAPEPEQEVEPEGQKPAAEGRYSRLGRLLGTLARAAGVTVVLALLAMPLAMLLGLLVAVGRLYGPRWLAALGVCYVEFLRGTPLMLQLFALLYVLPEVGIYLSPFWAGALGLAINYSASEAENYRAGLLAVPKGQMEAALALGMSTWVALRRVIVPQAVKIVVPPVTNDFIALFKDTALVSAIGATLLNQRELAGQYRQFAIDFPGLAIELALVTALLYLLMSYPLSLLARRLEHQAPKPPA